MNMIKKILGMILVLLAPVIVFFLLQGAFTHIDTAGKKDINNPLIWIIIIGIFTPIAVGLIIFGMYAMKGEYDQLPANSDDLETQ